MYAEFFGLRELPFNNTPDPRYFYSTPDHEEALASLIYAVKERKGFVLLTGEVGAGKTLVTRLMLRNLGPALAFANITHAVQSARDLIESVCTEFELPFDAGVSNAQLVRTLHDFLLAKFSQNLPVVLILDEAQNLPVEAFEQLRMIGNLEADDAKLLQIAIVGQPELQRLFQSPQLRQLRQRIFRSFHLPALDRKATEGYIRYRLSVAAARDLELFTPAAIDRIYAASSGLPRLINAVCDNAMLSAYSSDRRRIDADFVETVVSQMMPVGDVHMLQSGRVMPPAQAAAPARLASAQAPPQMPRVPAALPPAGRGAANASGGLLASGTPSAPDAGAAQASLERLSGRAKEIIAQGQAVARDLQCREDRIRELSSNVDAAAKRLCDLLARLQSASTESRRERQAAIDTTNRLATQTRESRRHLDELARRRADAQWSVTNDLRTSQTPSPFQGEGRGEGKKLANPASPPMSTSTASPTRHIVKTANAAAVVAPPRTPAVPPIDTGDLHRILLETQQSLADLRRIARPNPSGAPLRV